MPLQCVLIVSMVYKANIKPLDGTYTQANLVPRRLDLDWNGMLIMSVIGEKEGGAFGYMGLAEKRGWDFS